MNLSDSTEGNTQLLLHEQLSEFDEELIYFSLPDQEYYLYESSVPTG